MATRANSKAATVLKAANVRVTSNAELNGVMASYVSALNSAQKSDKVVVAALSAIYYGGLWKNALTDDGAPYKSFRSFYLDVFAGSDFSYNTATRYLNSARIVEHVAPELVDSRVRSGWDNVKDLSPAVLKPLAKYFTDSKDGVPVVKEEMLPEYEKAGIMLDTHGGNLTARDVEAIVKKAKEAVHPAKAKEAAKAAQVPAAVANNMAVDENGNTVSPRADIDAYRRSRFNYTFRVIDGDSYVYADADAIKNFAFNFMDTFTRLVSMPKGAIMNADLENIAAMAEMLDTWKRVYDAPEPEDVQPE